MKAYLAFDLGASSGRGMLGRVRDGKLELEEIHRFKNYPCERDGHFHWDFQSLLSEIKTGIRKAYEAEHDIESFSIDTWGVDHVIFRGGKPVRDPFCYRDPRTDTSFEAFHREVMSEDELYARTGIQLMHFNTVYQLYAHKKEHPEDFTAGSFALLMPDALLYALTDCRSSEYTMASTTALLNPHTRQWDAELLRRMEIPETLFPAVEMPGQQTFRLSEAVAAELGVPRLRAVKVGSHDTASAVASTPCDPSSRWAYISSGTWALLGTELPAPFTEPAAKKAGYTNEGALDGKIRFLTNIMGTWLLQETRRVWQENGRDLGFSDISRMAESEPDRGLRFEARDQVFLAPGDMPERIRSWFRGRGMEVPATDAALVRTIYDSLADCFRDSIRNMESLLGTRFEVLHILGGAIRDGFLMRRTAESCGIPVLTGPLEATATGNILSQMISAGELRDITEGRALVARSAGITRY